MTTALVPLIVVCIAVGCSNDPVKTEAGSTNSQAPAPEIKSVFVNGDSLHYIDTGKGEPVVFVHGTLDDYSVWQMELDTFAKTHRVIAYSRRYAYPNKQVINDSADYSVSIHAKDLAELIRSLDLGPVHLVGHSYGAYTALMTTIEHPDLVKSLVLGEPPVMPLLKNVPGGDTILNQFIARSIVPARKAFASGDNEKAVSAFIGAVVGDTGFFSKIPPEGQRMIMTNILELRGLAFSNDPFPMVNCDDLKKIKTPVLLITGENTALLFNAVTKELDKCLTNKEKAVLPRATHALEIENPGDFNKIVLTFINKH